MKAAVYLRVSTGEQSTDLQRSDILAHLAERGVTEFEVYEDRGQSGRKASRPALNRMLDDCRAGKVNLVICWKLDRLFRSLSHLLQTLKTLHDHGVAFVALRSQVDVTTAQGRFMMQMLGAFAEFEAELIRERVKAGLAEARRKGKKLGRRREFNPAPIKALRDRGKSYRQIARELGCSLGTVSRALTPPA